MATEVGPRLTPIQACALREAKASGEAGKPNRLLTYKATTKERLIEARLIVDTTMATASGRTAATYAITSLGITVLHEYMQERG